MAFHSTKPVRSPDPDPLGSGSGSAPNPPPGAGSGSGGTAKDLDLIAAARAQARVGSGSKSTWAVIPPESIPGYEILKEIHRGGQGVVYQAIQKATKRKVAVKVMREGPFAGPRDKARFEREVEILAQLNHPNIVSILDSGQAPGGTFYFVMDYISGHPLDVWMSRQERTMGETLKLFARICDAVNAAHLKGVIHRDLKPGNIRVDDSGEPHILDFGLAKTATGDISGSGAEGDEMRMMTMTGQFVGSLPWASPEQAEGHPGKIDVRTDVYSLGVILYQMLTGGRFPYQVVGAMRDVLDNILRQAPMRPSTVRRQINDEVETIVLKTLAKERDRRYQTAGELARDVRNYLGGFPIEAKRDSAVYQLRVMARRHKGAVGAATTVAAVVVLSAIALSWLWRRAESNRALAEQRGAELQTALDNEQAQRRRADENFESVRGLAKTAIFEFDDGIRNLLGGTATRQKLLTQARAYMEKLAAQAGDDPVLLRETADAADKVGDIEGGLNQPKTGTPGAASEAYQRARTIREKLLERFPSEARSHGDMGVSCHKAAQYLMQLKKYSQARDEGVKAIAYYDKAVSMYAPGAPDAGAYLEKTARAAKLVGDALSAMADSGDPDSRRALVEQAGPWIERSIQYWRERLREEPGHAESARMLSACLGARNSLPGSLAAPLARRADELAKAGDPGADAAFDAVLALYARMLEGATSSVSEFEQLVKQDPANREMKRGLMLSIRAAAQAHKNIAETHSLRARTANPREPYVAKEKASHHAALSLCERAEPLAQSLASSDSGNIEAQRDLAVTLVETGNELRDLGRLDEAGAKFERSLDIRRLMLRTDPFPRHRVDVALGLFKCAGIDERLGESAKDPAVQRERLSLALSKYRESLDIYNASIAEGATPADSRAVEVVRASVDRVTSRMKELSPDKGP